MNAATILRTTAIVGALTAGLATAHTAVNLHRVRRPANSPARIDEPVTIAIPARNEVHRIGPTLRSAMAQQGLADLQILILDDGSADGTGDLARDIAGADPRVTIVTAADTPPPTGWLGKSWACHRLAALATGTVLVFVDADVELTPHAVASTIAEMRAADLDLLSPYPRQIAVTWPERIIQPMVVWMWMAALPVGLTETRHYPSLAAAVGQFLVVDTRAYRISGGHAAVAGMVLEDVGVLRAVKRAGFRGTPADGSAVARCRMYEDGREIYEGYTKSLWSAFPPPALAYAVVAGLLVVYVAPPLLALAGPDRTTRRWARAGYAAGVAGRYLVARQTGERRWPDVAAQPASAAMLAGLIVASLRRRRAGTLTWRGRPLP